MNGNRLENYFAKDTPEIVSSGVGERLTSPEIWVTGLYDSKIHRAYATECLAHVTQLVGTAGQIHSEWWSLDAFTRPTCHIEAIESSRSSMMLWFAGDGCPAQIDLLQSWLSECPRPTGERRALVTFLERRCMNRRTESRLQSIAERHDFDLFFASSGKSPTLPVSGTFCRENDFFAQGDPSIRPAQIRGWGINE